MNIKKCSKCKTEKSVSLFSKDCCKKDGLRSSCKACCAASKKLWSEANPDYNKLYSQENRETIAAYNKVWYEENRETIAARRKLYNQENRETIAAYNKVWYEDNKESIAASKKIWREENRETIAARMKIYKQENKGRINSLTAKRRSAKLERTPKWLSLKELQEIRDLYTLCSFFTEHSCKDFHIDHILPLQGKYVSGLHTISNLQILPASENLGKHNNFIPG